MQGNVGIALWVCPLVEALSQRHSFMQMNFYLNHKSSDLLDGPKHLKNNPALFSIARTLRICQYFFIAIYHNMPMYCPGSDCYLVSDGDCKSLVKV